MKNKKMFIGLLLLCLVNFAAHLYFYPALPDTVPTHWGFNGQADGWAPNPPSSFSARCPSSF